MMIPPLFSSYAKVLNLSALSWYCLADTHKTTIELLEEGAENLNLKPHRMLRKQKRADSFLH